MNFDGGALRPDREMVCDPLRGNFAAPAAVQDTSMRSPRMPRSDALQPSTSGWMSQPCSGFSCSVFTPGPRRPGRTLEEVLSVGKWTAWGIMKQCAAEALVSSTLLDMLDGEFHRGGVFP